MSSSLRIVLCGLLAVAGCTSTRQVAVSGPAGVACVRACRARAGLTASFDDCVDECPGARESECRPNGTTCVGVERTTWFGTIAVVAVVVAVGLVVLYARAIDSLSDRP